jgi:hypothetical protein
MAITEQIIDVCDPGTVPAGVPAAPTRLSCVSEVDRQ